MNVSAYFIRHPVSTVLLTLSLMVIGIIGYVQLPISALPQMDMPTITVTANLPGASPETMASSVATPLEKQFATIPGVSSITSQSALGTTSITIQFDLDRDIDAAAQDVQSAISLTQRRLPDEMSDPPTYRKVNPAEQPIMFVSLSSKTLPLSQVYEYADTILSPRMATIAGVAQVNIFGSAKYAIRIQLDPQAMAARGIGLDEVTTAIGAANSNQPTGSLSGAAQTITLEATGQIDNAAGYRDTIVAWREGRPVRLGDIGQVVDSVQNTKAAAFVGEDRAVMLSIQRQPNGNTIEVVDRIRAMLPSIQAQLPASMEVRVLNDRSESIREAVDDVQFTLVLTMGLVILVIFIFLRNLTATAIPGIVLPLSILGTFAAMHQFGFSLDNISLMALTLAVGFVVDDAIVVLENIYRHREMGKPRLQAALEGAREIGFTVISMTLSLIAVFIPVLLMPGVVGRLFHEFAVTISLAILVSGILSLTLTPMMASRLLRDQHPRSHGRLYRAFERGFDLMLAGYRRCLDVVLRHHRLMLGVTLMTLVASFLLLQAVPKGFLPDEDNGLLSGRAIGSDDISYEAMLEKQKQVADIIAADPNVDVVSRFLGVGGSSLSINDSRMFIRLKPRDERALSAVEVIHELRPKLAHIPGMDVYLQSISNFPNFGGRQTRAQYQYTLQGSDLGELYRWSADMEARIRALPGFRDVSRELNLASPQALIEIDREKASSLGISAAQVENALYSAFGGAQISTIYTQSNQYWVMLELLPEYQRDLSSLSLLYVRSSSGRLVPLDTIASVSRSVGALTVNHQDQLPSVPISFNLAPGVSLSAAIAQIQAIERDVNLPAYITPSYQGTAQVFQQSLTGLGWLLLAALAVIYVVLGMLYESYIHPVTILSGIPSAGVGAILTLLLFGRDLNVISFIGVIMLIGIVKKNAIMMIDFALAAQRHEGMSPAEAIRDACLKRFRPIMMTTMAAIAGTMPIAVGHGAGAELRQPLGLAVVGGLVVSQLLTLFITPVIYLYMEKLRGLGSRLRRQPVLVPQPEKKQAAE